MKNDITSFMFFMGLCIIAIINWVTIFRFSHELKDRRPDLWKKWAANDSVDGWRKWILPLLLLKKTFVDTPMFILKGELIRDADKSLLKRERWARLAALVFYLYFFGIGIGLCIRGP